MTSFAFAILSIRPNTSPADGRYEYRVWPNRPISAVSALHRDWVLESAEKRADIYLLGPQMTSSLVKLRNGTRLEIKQRGPDHLGLQYWSVALSQDFPLSSSALRRLEAALMLMQALPIDAGLSPAHLLASLSRCADTIAPQIVRKSRLLFRQGSCRAEIARVGFGNRSRMSVALEDSDPASAGLAVDTLGLGHMPNQSYGDFLRVRLLLAANLLPDH